MEAGASRYEISRRRNMESVRSRILRKMDIKKYLTIAKHHDIMVAHQVDSEFFARLPVFPKDGRVPHWR